jgi:hypothetical protein
MAVFGGSSMRFVRGYGFGLLGPMRSMIWRRRREIC